MTGTMAEEPYHHGRTTGKPRYHHPDVTLRDMLDQRGE